MIRGTGMCRTRRCCSRALSQLNTKELIAGPFFFIFVLTLCCFSNFAQCDIDSAVDASWNFSDGSDLQGWADASVAEMQIIVTLRNGELKGIITGSKPNLLSPLLSTAVTPSTYVVIRMAHIGQSRKGEILLSNGPLTLHSGEYTSYRKFSFTENKKPIALSGSRAVKSSHGISQTTDNNSATYYLSSSTAAVYIVYDLGDYRWITSFKIVPKGGDDSPRRVLLQRSLSFSERGPYETVATFNLNATLNLTEPEEFSGFSGHARYWRVFVIDNYGGSGVGICDVAFNGYTDGVTALPFTLNNIGDYVTYYLPVNITTALPVLRMRLDFSQPLSPYTLSSFGDFQVDFVRIARAPVVHTVTGCLDDYYNTSDLLHPSYFVHSYTDLINGFLPLKSYSILRNYNTTDTYASTYNCPRDGGVNISIRGINFGDSARVYVYGKECPVLSRISGTALGVTGTIVCLLPAMSTPSVAFSVSPESSITVRNGVLPKLYYEYPGLLYAVPPPMPLTPKVTNVGACRVDLEWAAPGTPHYSMAITGYIMKWRRHNSSTGGGSQAVGNVTLTSIRGLTPGVQYSFAVASMSEGTVPSNNAALPVDLYGRRNPVSGAMYSPLSTYSARITTLPYDFDFPLFSAIQTLDSGVRRVPGASSAPSIVGPTGQFGGEGHYGLAVAGSANVQNCNVSSTCCDNFNSSGSGMCDPKSLVSVVILSREFDRQLVQDRVLTKQTPSNIGDPSGGPPVTAVVTFEKYSALVKLGLAVRVEPDTGGCGPALRLTSSAAREAGAAWYNRKVNVGEGFDTTFSFEISNPSVECDVMDDVHTFCRSRGADGLAFVVQDSTDGPRTLGSEGAGLGYGGISNALSVEFDTYMNVENLDSYENHVAVLTQGYMHNLTSNHSRALATSTRISDLTDGPHTARVRYDPRFDPSVLSLSSFQSTPHSSWFTQSGDYQLGGQGAWGIGLGLLYVYLDDLSSPVIITPLNLEATLALDHGRAYVGFTAACGARHWQTHDLLNWRWTSLFLENESAIPLAAISEAP